MRSLVLNWVLLAMVAGGAVADDSLKKSASVTREVLPVKCEIFETVGYQSTNETLTLTFKSGAVYKYYRVPPSLFRFFMEAESKGSFFHVFIKDGYPFKRVTSPKTTKRSGSLKKQTR